ncbi:MAG: hypothetical protein ACP5HG_15800 [Anaerolineae bacterium]
MALEDKDIPEDITPDEEIAAAVKARLVDGKLACGSAFAIAHKLGVEPLAVGEAADALPARLYHCQLGLFGYPNKQAWGDTNVASRPVPHGLPEALHAAKDESDHLTCAKLWELASEFRISRMQIGYLADKLGIKITSCQLGAF